MAKYKSYDYSQSVMIPVSLEDQLMPGTLEFAIHTLVETRMDTSIFTGKVSGKNIFLKCFFDSLKRKLEKLELHYHSSNVQLSVGKVDQNIWG